MRVEVVVESEGKARRLLWEISENRKDSHSMLNLCLENDQRTGHIGTCGYHAPISPQDGHEVICKSTYGRWLRDIFITNRTPTVDILATSNELLVNGLKPGALGFLYLLYGMKQVGTHCTMRTQLHSKLPHSPGAGSKDQ